MFSEHAHRGFGICDASTLISCGTLPEYVRPALPVSACRALLLTSGGGSGLGRQETPGQRWSGGRLEAVSSLVVCQWSSGHSVMWGLFAPAQAWNTHTAASCLWLFASCISVWSDEPDCAHAPGPPASSSSSKTKSSSSLAKSIPDKCFPEHAVCCPAAIPLIAATPVDDDPRRGCSSTPDRLDKFGNNLSRRAPLEPRVASNGASFPQRPQKVMR